MTRIAVRGYHEDRFGHVNNARYLEFLEEGRWDYLDQNGLGDAFFREMNVFPVIVRIDISYRRAASSGDVLRVETSLSRVKSRKLIFTQRVLFESSDELCAEAGIVAVFLDATTGRTVQIGEEMIRRCPALAEAREHGARAE